MSNEKSRADGTQEQNGGKEKEKRKKKKMRYVLKEFKRSKTRLWHKRSFGKLNSWEDRFEPHDKS